MKVTDIILSDRVTVSCELFPPKIGKPLADIKRIVREIAQLHPSFVSVTCSAGGSTGDRTVEVAKEVQLVNGVPALAHMTCVSSDQEDVRRTLKALEAGGVKNILALRGDLPADASQRKSDFLHASDLIEEIKRLGDFCVGGCVLSRGTSRIAQQIERFGRPQAQGRQRMRISHHPDVL